MNRLDQIRLDRPQSLIAPRLPSLDGEAEGYRHTKYKGALSHTDRLVVLDQTGPHQTKTRSDQTTKKSEKVGNLTK